MRGGIFDLFPPGEDAPVRLDFFGDTIESIRWFDPQSQRSEDTLAAVRVLPLSLFPGGPAAAARLAALLTAQLGEDISGPIGGMDLAPDIADRLEDLHERGGFPGWENYLPLLAGATTSLAGLLGEVGPAPLVFAVDPAALESEVAHHADRLEADFASRRDQGRLAVPPEALEQPAEAVRGALAGAALRLRDLVLPLAGAGAGAGRLAQDGAAAVDFHASTTDLFHGQLPRFPQEVATARSRGERCVVVVSPTHRERIEELLEGREVPLAGRGRSGGVELVTGELTRGFRLPAAGVVIYGEQQLLAQARVQLQQRRARNRFGPFVSSLRDLKVGDYVVHNDHGIGQFVALRTVGGEGDLGAALPPVLREGPGSPTAAATGGVEVMEISYASGKRLLLPLSRVDQVQKFSGIEGVAPRLDQLGGTSWNRTKARVKSSMRDMAGELLKLYAERQLAKAPALLAGHRPAAPVRGRLPLRGERRPAGGDRDHQGRPAARAADGPPALRRRRLRQDRGGDARRLQGGRRRLPGGGAGAHHHPRRPAPRDLPPALRGLAGDHRDDLALPLAGRDPRHQEAAGRRQGRHPDRHPPAAVEGHPAAQAGPADRRRGAALRRRAEGAPEAAARRTSTCSPCRRRRCRARSSCRSPACATCR